MTNTKYNEAKLLEFNSIIKEKLNDVEEQVQLLSSIRNKRKEGQQDANPGFGETSNKEQQASKNKASMRRLKTRLKELQRAQVRIENGTYGICRKTGNLISEERLKALPTATTCMLQNV
jgi:RNA polymerase-binding transcription factor DksA